MNLFTKAQKTEIRNLKPLTESKFLYDTNRWNNLNRNYKNLIIDFENKEISRLDVINTYKDYFTENGDSYLRAFLLTMVWGFADTGYGTFRTNKYISSEENLEKIKRVLDFINENKEDSIKNAFNELKKIKGLGISYLTKILYFATRAKGLENYSLIFDIRVARALVKLTIPKEIYEIIDVGPSSKFSDYNKFNELLHKIAGEIDVQTEQLEMYLFNQEF